MVGHLKKFFNFYKLSFFFLTLTHTTQTNKSRENHNDIDTSVKDYRSMSKHRLNKIVKNTKPEGFYRMTLK